MLLALGFLLFALGGGDVGFALFARVFSGLLGGFCLGFGTRFGFFGSGLGCGRLGGLGLVHGGLGALRHHGFGWRGRRDRSRLALLRGRRGWRRARATGFGALHLFAPQLGLDGIGRGVAAPVHAPGQGANQHQVHEQGQAHGAGSAMGARGGKRIAIGFCVVHCGLRLGVRLPSMDGLPPVK